MKKVLSLLLLLINVQVFAAWNDGMLRIREERGRSISVSVDGIRFDKIGRTVTVPNVAPGKHRLKVYTYNINGYGYRNGTMIYDGEIVVKPQIILYGTVFEKGINLEEYCCVDQYRNWNNNDNWDNWDIETETWNNNRRWNDRDRYESWNRNYQENQWNSYQGNLSIGRYQELIKLLRNASFESAKTDLIYTTLKYYSISTEQLIGLMKELSFESTKLDLAKTLYSKLIDKRNAFKIVSQFTFQSNRDEFIDFLNRQ